MALRGCCITTTGLRDDSRAKAQALIESMAGRYESSLKETCTHVIAVDLSGKGEVAKKHKMLVVSPEWLNECHRQEKRIPEAAYLLTSNYVPPPVSCSAPAPNSAAAHISSPVVTAQPVAEARTPAAETVIADSQISTTIPLLSGLVFAVCIAEPTIKEEVIKDLTELGAAVVDSVTNPRVTHLLCQYQNEVPLNLHANVVAVSTLWLDSCIAEKAVLPATSRALFRPVHSGAGIENANSLKICVSGFVGLERTYLKDAITIIGAEYTGMLKRDNTHLIFFEPSGQKYEKALEWNVKTVNFGWIEQSVKEWRLVNEQNFRGPYVENSSLPVNVRRTPTNTPQKAEPAMPPPPASGTSTAATAAGPIHLNFNIPDLLAAVDVKAEPTAKQSLETPADSNRLQSIPSDVERLFFDSKKKVLSPKRSPKKSPKSTGSRPSQRLRSPPPPPRTPDSPTNNDEDDDDDERAAVITATGDGTAAPTASTATVTMTPAALPTVQSRTSAMTAVAVSGEKEFSPVSRRMSVPANVMAFESMPHLRRDRSDTTTLGSEPRTAITAAAAETQKPGQDITMADVNTYDHFVPQQESAMDDAPLVEEEEPEPPKKQKQPAKNRRRKLTDDEDGNVDSAELKAVIAPKARGGRKVTPIPDVESDAKPTRSKRQAAAKIASSADEDIVSDAPAATARGKGKAATSTRAKAPTPVPVPVPPAAAADSRTKRKAAAAALSDGEEQTEAKSARGKREPAKKATVAAAVEPAPTVVSDDESQRPARGKRKTPISTSTAAESEEKVGGKAKRAATARASALNSQQTDSPRGGRPPSVPASDKVFLFSGFSKDEESALLSGILKLGGRVASDSHHFTAQATHVLFKELKRVEKLLGGCAAGAWILKEAFVNDSVAAGHWLAEATYEWNGKGTVRNIWMGAPNKWRKHKEETGEGAFAGDKFLIYGEPEPPRSLLEAVITAGGGVVVSQTQLSGVKYAVMSAQQQQDSVTKALDAANVMAVTGHFVVDYVVKEGVVLPDDYRVRPVGGRKK